MLRRIIKRLLEPRHYWRDIGFDELSELYTSQFLRSLALSLIGLFTPIYLYKIGYSLSDVAFFFVGWNLLRPVLDIASAYVVGKIGPKHTMLLSGFVHVVYLSLILTIEDLRWPLLPVAIIGSVAYSLYLLAIHVDFSKIKHVRHGGKELGYLVIVERIGGVIGPVVGGLVANYFDPRYTVGIAMLVLLGSAIPLFFSSEPVHTNQTILFRGIPYRKRWRDYFVIMPEAVENTVSLIIWPLFLALFVLGDNVFAKLGIITSIGTLTAIFVSRTIGGLIDKRRGGELLRVGVILNAGLHLCRPFVKTIQAAIGVNLLNEPLTAAYRMPFMKGFYDAADSIEGHRIAYISSMSAVGSVGRLLLWLAFWAGLEFLSERSVFNAAFILAAICSLAILAQKFEALKPIKVKEYNGK